MWRAILLACIVGLLVTTADAGERYQRVIIKTSGMALNKQGLRAIRELRMAVQRRDRGALHQMLGAKFEVLRDFGGISDAKLSAKQQFDVALPGWDRLEALSAAQTWGPFEPRSKLICGPAPLVAADERRLMRAARQRGDAADDYWFEWVYVDGAEVPVRAKPSFSARIVGRLSREAVRTLTLKNDWHKVALPNGEEAYLSGRAAIPAFSDRLCFRNVSDQWRLAAYVGGGD